MECNFCNKRLKVFDSVSIQENVFRKRVCEKCGKICYTKEEILTDKKEREAKFYLWTTREDRRKTLTKKEKVVK